MREGTFELSTDTPSPRDRLRPTITHQGRRAETYDENARTLVDISFPTPKPYEGDKGTEGFPAPERPTSWLTVEQFSRGNAKSPRKHHAEKKGRTCEVSFLRFSLGAATQPRQIAMAAL